MMRKQPKLFGGSEVRGPAAKPADQLSLFDGAEWLAAAQDWCRVHGLAFESWTVGRSFKAGGCWFVAGFDEVAGVWEFDQLKGA